jgi:hypothetical protein
MHLRGIELSFTDPSLHGNIEWDVSGIILCAILELYITCHILSNCRILGKKEARRKKFLILKCKKKNQRLQRFVINSGKYSHRHKENIFYWLFKKLSKVTWNETPPMNSILEISFRNYHQPSLWLGWPSPSYKVKLWEIQGRREPTPE